jgi:hypothetical protein
MLKLVGTEADGSIADEVILINDKDRPTKLLIGLAALELAFDITLACILARTVFKK